MPRIAIDRHSLQTHILTAMAAAALVGAVVIMIGSIRAERQRLQMEIAAQTNAFDAHMQDLVARETNNLELAVEMLLSDPDVVARFAARDRAWLTEHLVPLFDQRLKPRYGINQLHFHEPDAHSFLRVHQPKSFGDDLSRFRATVVEVNRRHQVVRGLEVGKFGPGLRVVMPLTHEGHHVGSVDAGADLGGLLADLADRLDLSFAIAIDQAVFANAGHRPDDEADLVRGDRVYYEFHGDLAKAAAHAQPSGAGKLAWLKLDGRRVVTSELELADWSGKRIGTVLLVRDVDGALAAARDRALANAALIIGLMLAAMGALAFLVRRRILQPLAAMTATAGRIAAGDLRQRVAGAGRDEIAALGGALDRMITCLHGLIVNVNQGSEQIAGAAMELDGRSERTVTDAQSALRMAAGVASAGESLRTDSQSIAMSTQAITERLHLVAAGITQMDATIDEIARSSGDAGQLSREANGQVMAAAAVARELAVSSGQINQVVDVISSIAGRTNLLALNATIEAASAGEAGRGFAVVASEVKALSRQTTQATDEVRQLIASVQSQIGEVVAQITRIEEVVASVQGASLSIAGAVEEQSATSKEIARATTAVRDDALSIAAHAEAGAAAADRIAQAITGVRATLEETTQQVGATRDNSLELTALSERLQDAVVVFQV